MKVKTQFLTTVARSYLEKGDLFSAIIRSAVDLEQLLFEKRIDSNLIDRWTLGKYIQRNIALGLVNKKNESLLKRFNALRNMVVHRRNFIESCLRNKKDKEVIIYVVLSICKFIDSNSVSYVSSQELQKNYGNLLKKWSKEEGKIFLRGKNHNRL